MTPQQPEPETAAQDPGPAAQSPAPAGPPAGPESRSESLAERLRGLYGEGVDPGIELEGEGGMPSDASGEIVRRLTERGNVFGRYRLKDELARGGQGTILRVWDEDLRRSLAMKVILDKEEKKRGTAGLDTRSLGRFLEEAQVTGQLDHPGIVPVHELGVDSQGRVYFTMKLVRGRDLKSMFKLVHSGQEGWTVTRALGVLLKVCEAMAYAHSKGVIHRDLKPGNVMVGRFGEVFVMDWGLARILGRPDRKNVRIQPAEMTQPLNLALHEKGSHASDAPLLTMDGDVVGTPSYMSPEQASGELDRMGPHSDVYSAGAMLYHLLAGQLPYMPPGVKLSNYAIWYRVQEGPPTPLHELAPEVPAELCAICEKAMARDVARRYRDMSELAEDLRAYLEHRVVSAYETGAFAELRKWVRRNRGLAAALAAAIALALGGLGGVGVVEAHGRRTADRLRGEAQANELIARAERASALRLSAFRNLEELDEELERLWPPHPARIRALENWLAGAGSLVAGLDSSSGDYPGHRKQLEILRARALRETPEDHQEARRAHPRYGDFAALNAKVESLRAVQRVRAGEPELEFPLDPAAPPANVQTLNERAWRLVRPDRTVHGNEAEGLALARLGFSLAASDLDRAEVGDTLAWALFANGLDDEALDRSHAALEDAPSRRRAEFEGYLGKLERAIAEREEGAIERELAALEPELRALEAQVNAARKWRFASPEDQVWHDQLEKLVERIEAFADPEQGPMGAAVSAPFGWGVERRLAFARTVEERTVSGPEARDLWREALDSIADPRACPLYEGRLSIEPQLGLLPVGRDPDSGLWEFAHVQTGAVPARDPDGRLAIDETSGLVFVLIPEGTFTMGAQGDPAGPSYDPDAQLEESPPRPGVRRSSFFFSKYEMTQAQWRRLTGEEPSFFQLPPESSPLHPVESVSWKDCARTLRRAGLELPTEAQWEYAARAGTRTPWWTGADRSSLAGCVNLAGEGDRFKLHAPVNHFRPNPFGLLNVLGNVWEWCQDTYDEHAYEEIALADPLVEKTGSRSRVFRGASFSETPEWARSAQRAHAPEYYLHHSIGVRPVRAIDR